MKRTLLGAAAGLPGGAVFGAAIGAFLTNGIVPELLLPYIAGGAGLGLIAGAIAGDPKKVFGSKNERELKRLRPLVQRINDFEEALTALSDEELRAKTEHFRSVLARATQPEREELEGRAASCAKRTGRAARRWSRCARRSRSRRTRSTGPKCTF